MENKIIHDFHRKMTDERIKGHRNYENELKELHKEILSEITADYKVYRMYMPKFLSSLESNNEHSVSYSILLFFKLYKQLMGKRQFCFFDMSIMEHNADYDILKKITPILEASYSKNNQQRLSEENFDISTLTENEKKEVAALIIRKLQDDSKQLSWNKDMIDYTMMQLIFLRQILSSLNNVELFYHAIGMFFDRLTTSEFYQAGRDIAEEVIVSSYKDGIPELGYFNSFLMYSNLGNIHASLMYANLCLTCILKKKPPYSERLVKGVVWQSIKFFRNVNLYPWAAKIYSEVPVELKFHNYERRSLDHSYFTVLLKMMDPALPSKLLDYLYKEREEILNGGVHEASPWLLTLYNIRKHYPMADFSAAGFGFFLSTFEMIVPTDTVKKYKDVIQANSDDLKKYLKESLVKLNDTRNCTDFVYDNESALGISSRLIEYSVMKKDAPTFLLSMLLKSDYSILFKQKESKELAPLIIPEVDVDSLETLYEDKIEFLNALPLVQNISMNWLAFSEGKLYHLQLCNSEYSFSQLSDWNYNLFKELLDSNYFLDLCFDDTVKDKGGIRQLSLEEFEDEEKRVAEKLSIAKLQLVDKVEGVYVIKDMELSKYPHNLFLNESGDFIAKNTPVTNVLSTEWLLQTNVSTTLSKSYGKSIWIPIESGDIQLNWLFSGIENTLKENDFEVFTQVELQQPLSADINIVCSHGAKNISEVQIVYHEDSATYNLNTVVGEGKILIFFVCYSGSMKTEFFRNNVTSMVKNFIAKGYEAVVAPFWALDVTIPRYWLPEFLQSLDNGLTVSQAMFNANKKVYEKYPTPAAWACLHLYGNPNLKVNSVYKRMSDK